MWLAILFLLLKYSLPNNVHKKGKLISIFPTNLPTQPTLMLSITPHQTNAELATLNTHQRVRVQLDWNITR